MAKKGKLLTALDAHMGRNYKVQKQKALQKRAEKKKKKAKQAPYSPEGEDADEHGARLKVNGDVLSTEEDSDGWESEKSKDAPTAVSEKACLEPLLMNTYTGSSKTVANAIES